MSWALGTCPRCRFLHRGVQCNQDGGHEGCHTISVRGGLHFRTQKGSAVHEGVGGTVHVFDDQTVLTTTVTSVCGVRTPLVRPMREEAVTCQSCLQHPRPRAPHGLLR